MGKQPFLLRTDKAVIGLGAKVATNEGDGIVVGITHTDPAKYDVHLLATREVKMYMTEEEHGVRLLDNAPIDDPDIPESNRAWLKTRP